MPQPLHIRAYSSSLCPTAPLQPRILGGSSSQLNRGLPHSAVKACSYAAAASMTRAGHITLLPRDLPPITLPPLTQQRDSFPSQYTAFSAPYGQRGCPCEALVASRVYRSSITPFRMVAFYTQFNR